MDKSKNLPIEITEKIERCLREKVSNIKHESPIPREKIVTFSISGKNYANAGRLFESIRTAIYYFISKEKVRNSHDFTTDMCLYNYFTKKAEPILLDIPSSEGFNSDHYKCCLKPLLPFMMDERIIFFVLFFRNGNFEEDEPKEINGKKTFTSETCVICLENIPNIHFVDCGHICLCEACNRINMSSKCPICKTRNNIKRKK